MRIVFPSNQRRYLRSTHHAKVIVVDGAWSVVGTTNFDNRSFGLNDEVNLATCEPALAARLDEDFGRDLSRSHRVSYEEWRDRPWSERRRGKTRVLPAAAYVAGAAGPKGRGDRRASSMRQV